MYRSTFFRDLPRGGHNVIFVVFTIGDDHHSSCSFAVHIKSFPAGLDGPAHSCSLDTDHPRMHRCEEQFHSLCICGQWTLYIGFACEHHQANPVTSSLGHEPLDRSFGKVQTGHANIFCKHAVADVHGDHQVDAFGLYLFELASHFGVQPCYGQGRQGPSPEQKFPCRLEHRVSRKHRIQPRGVCQSLDGAMSPTDVEHHQQGAEGGEKEKGPGIHPFKGEAGRQGTGSNPCGRNAGPKEAFQEQEQAQNRSYGAILFHACSDLKRVVRSSISMPMAKRAMAIHAVPASLLRW